MKNRNNQKLEAITSSTLIVGVDIAKELQWARFVDYRGLEQEKAFKFTNNKNGFENILTNIETICKKFNRFYRKWNWLNEPNYSQIRRTKAFCRSLYY